MATNTRIYESTDAGAPILTGQVGSLISLLKTVLVGTSGVAYGSKAAAGWTVAFEDVVLRKIAFRNSMAAGGTGCYLRIDDNGGLSQGAREASVRVFQSMTTVDVGLDETPTTLTQPAGCVWRKSSTLDATARAWCCIADERTIYFWSRETVGSPGSTVDVCCPYVAGDYLSDDPLQTCPFLVSGYQTSNAVVGSPAGLVAPWSSGTSILNLWLSRSVSHATGPVKAGFIPGLGVNQTAVFGSPPQSFPNPQTGSGNTYFTPAQIGVYVSDTNKTYMGRMRGAWLPLSVVMNDANNKVYTGGSGFGFTNLRLLKQNYALNLGSGSFDAGRGGICIETGESW